MYASYNNTTKDGKIIAVAVKGKTEHDCAKKILNQLKNDDNDYKLNDIKWSMDIYESFDEIQSDFQNIKNRLLQKQSDFEAISKVLEIYNESR